MAPSLKREGGRVCAVITITATANANWKSLLLASPLTLGLLCVTPRFQFRLFHFQLLPIFRRIEIFTQSPSDILARLSIYLSSICFSFHRATRDADWSGGTTSGQTKSPNTTSSSVRVFHPSSVHHISTLEICYCFG